MQPLATTLSSFLLRFDPTQRNQKAIHFCKRVRITIPRFPLVKKTMRLARVYQKFGTVTQLPHTIPKFFGRRYWDQSVLIP